MFAILTPIIAALIKMAISREREYLADASAAHLTRNPSGLASALRKIGGDKNVLRTANKAMAHLYIGDPLKNRHSKLDNLFSTHPPISKRIARLESI